MIFDPEQVKIFSGEATINLAERIALGLGTPLGKILKLNFSDGEYEVSFDESVRGKDVFIVQSTVPPADNMFELLMLIDAAKRASARKIIAVLPYYGYARQDRKSKSRVAITAKLIANLLTAAGVNRVITMDLHSDQIQGFFDIPVDHLFGSSIFIPYLRNLNLPNITIASPDAGGAKRALAFAKFLQTEMVLCVKQRAKENQIEKMTLIGEVTGKDIILVDDIIDTAGTIAKAADIMMEAGATSVRAVCTHALLSGNAFEKIEKSQLKELIVTDTIPLRESHNKITVLSTSDVFADVIYRLLRGESISTHFNLNTII